MKPRILKPLAVVTAAYLFGTAFAQTSAPESPETTARPLGRVFFTPEIRASLDRQRLANTAATPGLASTLRLDGTVVRSNGKRTYWINGQPRTGAELPPGLVAETSARTPAKTTFRLPGEAPATLRVGESVLRAGASNGTPTGTDPAVTANSKPR